MAISTFPAPAAAVQGGGTDLFQIAGGLSVVLKEFEIGVYAFRANSNTSTEASGTISFANSNNEVIASVTLVDTNTGGTSSPFFGSVFLPEQATAVFYSGPLGVNGVLEILYSPGTGAKRVLTVSTTTSDFVLPFQANAHVFGGGGGGGGSGATSGGGGGGGGSGFLTIDSVAPGTYNAVIGAGGLHAPGGSNAANGLTGGTSQFGSLAALGGEGGTSAPNQATGGNGGSGGGSGRKPNESAGFGFGGVNGSAGGSNGTATGGSGSGIAQSVFFLTQSQAGATTSKAGVFYAGGNGGDGAANERGQFGANNSASGGGGSRFGTGSNTGSNGGSGIIFLVEV